MKTYNQFLNTPFSEEVKPPEPQEEDPGIKSKEKRQAQIKKQVLLKKMQAVRAGAGGDIVASHTPEGEMVEDYGKENFTPHKMIDPSSKKVYMADTYEKHMKYKKMGYVHEEKNCGCGQTPCKTYGKKKVKVKEGTDKAFEFVKKQIAAKYGKSGYVSKDNPRKPQSAADKAKVRAHQAKVDKENAAERAKDPSQGRYPKG